VPPYRDPDALRRARDAPLRLGAPRETAPPLPAGTDWPAWLTAWWSGAWCSPLTADWSEALDLPAVARLGALYLRLADDPEPNAALLAQVVKLETELGLSPASRRRQHIKPALTSAPTRTSAKSARNRLKITADDL
jgi:hypothetical protein